MEQGYIQCKKHRSETTCLSLALIETGQLLKMILTKEKMARNTLGFVRTFRDQTLDPKDTKHDPTNIGEDPWEPPDSKEIQPIHPEGDQSWVFTGRTDAEAETPMLWPPDAKSWLLGKDPDAGKDWGQEEKRTTEDEMVGWHHRFDGHEFE